MNAALDIDHLSKLAEAATPAIGYGQSPWDNRDLPQMDMILPRKVLVAQHEYIVALNPATVQELIRLARIGMTAEATSSPPAA